MSIDESVEQGSLRRIREQTRAVDECEAALFKAESELVDAKASRDAAKEAWMRSLRDLRDLSREETIGLPLFPAFKDDEKGDGPAPMQPPTDGPIPEPASRDEATFLSTIGVKVSLIAMLGSHGIETVADLRMFLETIGTDGTDIIDAKGVHHLRVKLKKWDDGERD